MVHIFISVDIAQMHLDENNVSLSLKAQEIRAYLLSCGSDIKEESSSPLHEDLDQMLSACDVNFKNEIGLWAIILYWTGLYS